MLSVSICTIASAQQITFSKVYYDSLNMGIGANAFVPTFDNKYIVAGGSFSSAGGYIMKIDSAGNSLWSKTIACDGFNCIVSTNDSCYILGGSKYNGTFSDAFCTKINSAGSVIWSKTFSANDNLKINSILQTFDSGFVMTGTLNMNAAPYSKIFIAKMDAALTISWVKFIVIGSDDNEGFSVKQAPDSSYYVAGNTADYPPYNAYAFAIHLSESGTVLWAKKYNSGSYIVFSDFIVIYNGLVFYLDDGGNAELAKTDFSGNILWNKCYQIFPQGPHMFFPQVTSKVHQTADTSLVFVSGSCGGSSMAKTDSSGNVIWSRSLILDVVEAVETKDKGYFIFGNGPMCGSKQPPTTSSQIGILKTDSLGNDTINSWWGCMYDNPFSASSCIINSILATFGVSGGITSNTIASSANNVAIVVEGGCVAVLGAVSENKEDESISISPNPFTTQTTVEIKGNRGIGEIRAEVYDVFGREVKSLVISHSPFTIERGNLGSGVYFLRLTEENKIFTGKLVITD